jgi:hypothetical protein
MNLLSKSKKKEVLPVFLPSKHTQYHPAELEEYIITTGWMDPLKNRIDPMNERVYENQGR